MPKKLKLKKTWSQAVSESFGMYEPRESTLTLEVIYQRAAQLRCGDKLAPIMPRKFRLAVNYKARIRATLQRLVKEGAVRRVRPGFYRLNDSVPKSASLEVARSVQEVRDILVAEAAETSAAKEARANMRGAMDTTMAKRGPFIF